MKKLFPVLCLSLSLQFAYFQPSYAGSSANAEKLLKIFSQADSNALLKVKQIKESKKRTNYILKKKAEYRAQFKKDLMKNFTDKELDYFVKVFSSGIGKRLFKTMREARESVSN